MTQIIRATHLGFCFGVRDALEAASQVAQPDQASVYGELVHNSDVTNSLKERRFELLAETERDVVPDRPLVMVTAHGISQTRRRLLLDSGKELIDTTCPLVQRVHDAATRLADRGYFVVVIGNANHVEVLGVVEDLPPGSWDVVSDPADVAAYDAARIGIVCQSTMPEELATRCRDRVAECNPGASVRWVNTICRPTRQRQAAVDSLCEQVEVVIVVGGANSNNTRRLVQRCESLGRPAHHVQSAADIQPEWLAGRARIGLTAGTSTPDATIDAVETRLRELTQHAGDASRTRSCETWTNRQWTRYFERNLRDDPLIPWSVDPNLTKTQRTSIAKSVQIFQLGESGEGRHLRNCAQVWIDRGGDPDYLAALTLFVQEENRHADWLGQFLAQEDVPLLQEQWSDGCFRFLRHLAGLRTSISVLVTAEILAQVYYLALLRATNSPALQSICKRILRDERAHVTFQQNQNRELARRWGRLRRTIVAAMENVLFEIARRIVWHDHNSVFLAAGMDWKTYRKRTTRRWKAARRSTS